MEKLMNFYLFKKQEDSLRIELHSSQINPTPIQATKFNSIGQKKPLLNLDSLAERMQKINHQQKRKGSFENSTTPGNFLPRKGSQGFNPNQTSQAFEYSRSASGTKSHHKKSQSQSYSQTLRDFEFIFSQVHSQATSPISRVAQNKPMLIITPCQSPLPHDRVMRIKDKQAKKRAKIQNNLLEFENSDANLQEDNIEEYYKQMNQAKTQSQFIPSHESQQIPFSQSQLDSFSPFETLPQNNFSQDNHKKRQGSSHENRKIPQLLSPIIASSSPQRIETISQGEYGGNQTPLVPLLKSEQDQEKSPKLPSSSHKKMREKSNHSNLRIVTPSLLIQSSQFNQLTGKEGIGMENTWNRSFYKHVPDLHKQIKPLKKEKSISDNDQNLKENTESLSINSEFLQNVQQAVLKQSTKPKQDYLPLKMSKSFQKQFAKPNSSLELYESKDKHESKGQKRNSQIRNLSGLLLKTPTQSKEYPNFNHQPLSISNNDTFHMVLQQRMQNSNTTFPKAFPFSNSNFKRRYPIQKTQIFKL